MYTRPHIPDPTEARIRGLLRANARLRRERDALRAEVATLRQAKSAVLRPNSVRKTYPLGLFP